MRRLSIGELRDLVDGRLRLGSLPPLAGVLEPLGRIVVESRETAVGDVYWALEMPGYEGARWAEEAFLRGAMGVVTASRYVEPWAGKFSLRVIDANIALEQLAQSLSPRPRGPWPRRRSQETTTRLVRAMLEGYAIGLDEILDCVLHGANTVLA